MRKAASGSGRPPARRPGGTERTRPAPAGPGEPRAHPAEAGTVGAPPRARCRANAARPAARRRHSPGRWWSWPPSCPPRRQGARRSRDSFRARAERRALASALRQAAGGGLARVPGSGVTGGGAGGGAGSRHGPGPRPPLASCRVPGPAGRPWRTRGAPAPWCLRQRDWRCSGHRAEAPGAEPRPSPGGPRCPEPPAVGAPCRDPSPALPRSALPPALPCGLKYTGKAGSRAGGAVTAVLRRKACSKGQACC